MFLLVNCEFFSVCILISSLLGSEKYILMMKIGSTVCPSNINELHSGLAILFPYMDMDCPDIKVLERYLLDMADT